MEIIEETSQHHYKYYNININSILSQGKLPLDYSLQITVQFMLKEHNSMGHYFQIL